MAASTVPLMSAVHNQYSEDIVIRDETGLIRYKSKPVAVCIDRQHVTVTLLGKAAKTLLQYDSQDLIGLKYTHVQRKKASYYKAQLILYPVVKGCCSSNKAEKKRKKAIVELHFDVVDQITLQTWSSRITHYVGNKAFADIESDSSPTLTRKFLIFVNPKSGKGTAMKIWKTVVEPIFIEAGIDSNLVVTQYAGHAREYGMQQLDLQTESIVVIGGDGLLYEVVNGLAARPDKDAVFKAISLVHIPGGTGNGLAKSILYQSHEFASALNATIIAVRGSTQSLDLSCVVSRSQQTHYAFLSLAWGLIADIDIMSEGMRYLGEMRLYVAALYFIMRRRFYSGVLRLKLATRSDASASSPPASTSSKEAKLNKKINRLLPGETVDGDGWVEVAGKFMMVLILQTSHISMSVHSGPGLRLGSGVMRVYAIQDIGRLGLIQLMLDFDSGAFIHHSSVRIFDATEYILTPVDSPDGPAGGDAAGRSGAKKGIYSLDGEVVEYGTLHGSMMPAAASVKVLVP